MELLNSKNIATIFQFAINFHKTANIQNLRGWFLVLKIVNLRKKVNLVMKQHSVPLMIPY